MTKFSYCKKKKKHIPVLLCWGKIQSCCCDCEAAEGDRQSDTKSAEGFLLLGLTQRLCVRACVCVLGNIFCNTVGVSNLLPAVHHRRMNWHHQMRCVSYCFPARWGRNSSPQVQLLTVSVTQQCRAKCNPRSVMHNADADKISQATESGVS